MYFIIFLIATIGIFICLNKFFAKQEHLSGQQGQYMEELDDYFTEQRMGRISRYRHDLANHRRTLEALAPDARKVEVLKTLLIIKQDVCREENIDVKTQIAAKSLELLASAGECSEMVSLLANLFDNAIEAVIRMENPGNPCIFLGIQRAEDGIKLIMTNPYEEIRGFKTLKDNQEEHGYGLKIIREIIERKHGSMDIQLAEGICRMECFLPEIENI